jgi:hypothetical protein
MNKFLRHIKLVEIDCSKAEFYNYGLLFAPSHKILTHQQRAPGVFSITFE